MEAVAATFLSPLEAAASAGVVAGSTGGGTAPAGGGGGGAAAATGGAAGGIFTGATGGTIPPTPAYPTGRDGIPVLVPAEGMVSGIPTGTIGGPIPGGSPGLGIGGRLPVAAAAATPAWTGCGTAPGLGRDTEARPCP